VIWSLAGWCRSPAATRFDGVVTATGHVHLAGVMPSVLAALGVAGTRRALDLPDVSRACVLLVDGLGRDLLREHGDVAPTLTGLVHDTLDVGYPATTAAGLAAIGTGLPAGEHGFVGYSFDVPGVGLINALRWRAHPSGAELGVAATPEHLQPLPTTFDLAARAGLTASVVSDARFADSSLTRAVLRGADYRGVHALGDLAAQVGRVLRGPSGVCYAYHSELDLLGHLYGPGSPEWRMQLRHVDQLVATLAHDLPADSLLAVVADHGMVTVDDTALDVDSVPRLWEGVRAVGGEVRARHVYTVAGAGAEVLATWRETLADRARVLSREEAVAAGWFGPTVSDRVRARIGDVVAAARGRSGMLRREAEPGESALLGQHGSHTAAERRVPLLLAYR